MIISILLKSHFSYLADRRESIYHCTIHRIETTNSPKSHEFFCVEANVTDYEIADLMHLWVEDKDKVVEDTPLNMR